MKNTAFFIICFSILLPLLYSCDIENTTKPSVLLETDIESGTTAQHLQEQAITVNRESPEKAAMLLDLSWENTLETPTVKDQRLLPDFFKKKKPEAKKTSLSGKFYRKDDPQLQLLDSVEGAEVSVKVRIP